MKKIEHIKRRNIFHMEKYIRLPLVGASIPTGIGAVNDFLKLKLGNIILINPPENKKDALEVMRLCKEKHIYVIFSEIVKRGWTERKLCQNFTKKDFDEIIDAAGEYYLGRYAIGEAGGILYWPKAYTIGRAADVFLNLPKCDSAEDAHKSYIKYLKDFMKYERKKISGGNLINVESSFLFNYQVEAGIDALCLELLPADPFRMIPSIRGAAKAFDKNWGVHIAMGWYGGIQFDEIWLKRWKLSLYYSFMSGAEYVYPESGHYDYDMGRENIKYDFHHPKMKESRKILREFWRFSQVHRRPKSGPNVSVGIVLGNNEGCPGLWNPYAWGQYENGEKWEAGPAEKGWTLLDSFFKTENCFNETFMGDLSFSGNPPQGQYDIVPVECSIEKLKKYKCLAFVGWNDITDSIYEKLIEYVSSGGHLLMWLPHLNVEKKRGAEIRLFRNGMLNELFGIEVTGKEKSDVMGIKYFGESSVKSYKLPYSNTKQKDPSFLGKMTPAKVRIVEKTAKVICGFSETFNENTDLLTTRPALIENKLGKGCAWLVTAFEYPGDDGMRQFAENIFRIVLNGEQGGVRLICSDSIKYAVYDTKVNDRKFKIIYILNTEFEVSQAVKIFVSGTVSDEIIIPSSEMKSIYIIDNSLIICPESKDSEIHSIVGGNNSIDIGFYSLTKQNVKVINISDKNYKFSLNDIALELPRGKTAKFKCPGKANPGKTDFYSKSFLSEPKIKLNSTKLPY